MIRSVRQAHGLLQVHQPIASTADVQHVTEVRSRMAAVQTSSPASSAGQSLIPLFVVIRMELLWWDRHEFWMAYKRLETGRFIMQKQSELDYSSLLLALEERLRLACTCGLSQREVAQACGMSRSTVRDYLRRAGKSGLALDEVRWLDMALEARL